MTKVPTAKPVEPKKAPAAKAPAAKTPEAEKETTVATPAAEQKAPEAEKEAPAKKKATNVGEGVGYTYIGGGEDSPRVINFMGKQKFVRGELTFVTDPDVLAKLEGASTFVKGEADQETLHRIDEEAKAFADHQRAEAKLLDLRFKKKHAGE